MGHGGDTIGGFGGVMKKRGRRKLGTADCRTSFLKSVERTLDVLELLSKRRLVGITELARTMKIANSTAHRILSTLEKHGFAVQDFETGKYALGHMVFQLTRSVMHTMEPVRYVRPYLQQLRDKVHENIAFGVVSPDKDSTLILAEAVADKAVIARPVLFERFPIHVCTCGRAYLATLNDRQLKAVLSKHVLRRFTKHTCVSVPALKRRLTQSRRLGYAVSRDEFSIGFSTMASGAYGAAGNFAGAIMLSSPSDRFTDKNIKAWAKVLLQATARFSLELERRGIGIS